MTRLSVISLVLLLAACDAGTRGLGDVPASRQQVEGAVFNVYASGDLAQAVRINRQFAPRIGPLAGQAAVAIQQATGCRVTEIAGDAAVLVGRLQCPSKVPACQVDAVLKGPRGASLPVIRRCSQTGSS